MKKHTWLLPLIFALILIGWIVYSYAHIDLNLTLSANSVYQSFQQQLIQIGYYQRPLSAGIFSGLLLITFLFYFLVLYLALTKRISRRIVWWLVGVSGILILAYPALSHDVFNYLFDARIVTHYGLNPSYFKALDFPFDPWVRFMRWTHRYYPYGPGWLLVSLIPSYLGFGKFVLTLFLFKLLMAGFHVANCWLIGKLADKEFKSGTAAIVFFAFNPLILLESLLTPHNEVVMLTFLLLALYLVLRQKNSWGMLSLLASVSIKFVTLTLVPLFIFARKISEQRLLVLIFWFALCSLIPVLLQREAYSWYFVVPIGLASITQNKFIRIISIGMSAGVLLRYIPYIFWGDYSLQTQQWQTMLLILGFFAFLSLSFFLWPKTHQSQ